MFRNTLTANRKYSFRDLENLLSPTQIQLSWKLKNCGPFFFFFFWHVWNLHQILKYLKKKMIIFATLFRKLQIVKDLIRPLFKKECFRNSFEN